MTNIRQSFFLTGIAVVMLLSCTKKQMDTAAGKADGNAYLFKDLPKYGDTIVHIKSADKVDIKNYLDRLKLNGTGEFVRDSIWPSNTGHSSIYTTDEQVVVPDNQAYIYPGSLIRGNSVNSSNFVPLPIRNYKRVPITVSVSFPSDAAVGVIDTPSLSRTRVFLRKALLDPGFSGGQIEEFLYETFNFSYYDEIKRAYGSNVNVKGLFYSSNSSFNFQSTTTDKGSAMVAKFTLKNFVMKLEAPQNGKLIDETNVDQNVLQGYVPVYVNSITYGRMGIIVIESNESSVNMKTQYETTIRKIFKRTNETLTEEEKRVINSSRINIYLIGGSGAPQTQSVTGVDEFIRYIVSSGTFSANDPGVPISFTMKYLGDNSTVKTTFSLDYPR
jgi:thiol-activated cytolysin